MILDRYFARRFAKIFSGIFAVFFGILAFVGLVDQLRRFSDEGATFGQILELTLLDIPTELYEILPLIMIISAITLFLGLARSSELVVTRAAGRSALRALMAPLGMALFIGALAVSVMNPIVAGTQRQYEALESELRGTGSILSLGASGLWLRQGDATQQTVIRAGRANLSGTELSQVTFLTFQGGMPVERVEAERASLGDGAWRLRQAKVWPLDTSRTPESLSRFETQMTLPSTLTADQIRDSFGTPSSIPIWDLPAFIDRLQVAGFSAQRHQVWLQMELAQPLFLAAMVMIGAAFTMRHQRGGRTGLMVMLAILLSFTVYFLRNFAQVLGENGDLPPALAAWVPPLIAIGLSAGMLLHLEDG
ncbi:MAG: LPS export ABC transporter permease LptG [Loktanella sp.]|nr:LPS export ABC transporter permease LptG [Loktanella sp.]